MKKFLVISVILLSLSFCSIYSIAEEQPGPVCDYSHCPGGYWNCCTQNGVTLYINP